MLAHPSVAPHVERAKPYVHRAVEITTPILLRTQQEWNLYVVPQWEKRIVPEWKKLVVPQWNKYVVSQWDKHVAPRIQLVQSKVEPHRRRVIKNYEQRILPRAQIAFYNLQRWHRQAEPYVLLALSKTKDGYYAAKPYAIPIAKKSGHLLQQFALFLREQRQKFVDPHVAKMWEKVKELSRGRQVIPEAMPEHESASPDVSFTILETMGYETALLEHHLTSLDVSPTILETLGYKTTASPAYSATVAYDASVTPEGTDVAQTPSSLSADETTMSSQSIFAEASATLIPEPATSTQLAGTPTNVGSSPSAESVLVESPHESESVTSDASAFVEEPNVVTSSVSVAATATLSSSASPTADEPTKLPASVTQSKFTIAAASATVPPGNSYTDDEIDFDAFYAELGLNEPLGNSDGSQEYTSAPPSPPAETEEEKAERLRLKAEETARKRADIQSRQAKWEAELQVQMESGTSRLQSRLSNLRTAAATELASSAEVRSSIEELVNEGEKYLKGAEIYLKNLKGESRRPDEKLALWDRVADRVHDKFNERLLSTEGVVTAWYEIVLDKEIQEVRKGR